MKTSSDGKREDGTLLASAGLGARAAAPAFVGGGRGRLRAREGSGRWPFACLIAAALVLSSCSLPLPEAVSDQTRFYVLMPVAGSPAAAAPADAGARRVFLRAVFVPEFLRGKIMPVRVAGHEVKYVDTARWAEPLEPGLTRVLREDLGRRSGAVQVVGSAGEARDYNVIVRLQQCEGVLPEGVARLAAHVEIFSAEMDPTPVAVDDFTTEVPGWNGADYGQLAAKLSEAAAALSDRIAELLPAKTP
jgi:uncharacterized lipoprotein YmbA